MSGHLIDVLIPAFNAAQTIEEAVRSIQAQTVRDIQIIIVDDGSSDGTGALLAELARHDPRILVVTTPNGGIVSALNVAIAHSTAPFIARHDADDNAFPERFARQIEYLNDHPDCVAVAANVWHIDAQGNRTGTRSLNAGDVDFNATRTPSREPYLIHPLLMIRREALIAAGGYRYILHSEDTDLYWRLLPFGRLHNLPDLLADYRIHPGSVSSASIANGRLAAVSSQLAAISFLRERSGVRDLEFSREQSEQLKSCSSMRELLAAASAGLTGDEAAYIRRASAAKLLELASYRPYLLEPEDLAFIHGAIGEQWWRFSPAERSDVQGHFADLIVRLSKARQWSALAALRAPVRAYAVIAIRYARRRLGPIRHAITRGRRHDPRSRAR